MVVTVTATFGVVAAVHAPLFYAQCAHCNKILSKGSWAVFVEIHDKHFFVGAYPKVVCCSKEARVPFFFNSKSKALDMRDEVMEQVRRDRGSLMGFNFYAAESYYFEKVH